MINLFWGASRIIHRGGFRTVSGRLIEKGLLLRFNASSSAEQDTRARPDSDFTGPALKYFSDRIFNPVAKAHGPRRPLGQSVDSEVHSKLLPASFGTIALGRIDRPGASLIACTRPDPNPANGT